MPATTPRQFRLSDDELRKLDDIGWAWGPVKPLSRTEVIREMIRRTWKAESQKIKGLETKKNPNTGETR